DFVRELLAPLDIETASGAARGILYQLEQGLGTTDARAARDQIEALDDADRQALEERGGVIGERTVFVRSLLGAEPVRRRAILVRVHTGGGPIPQRGAPSLPRERGTPAERYLAVGFVPLGPRAVRADLVERALAILRERTEPFEAPVEI